MSTIENPSQINPRQPSSNQEGDPPQLQIENLRIRPSRLPVQAHSDSALQLPEKQLKIDKKEIDFQEIDQSKRATFSEFQKVQKKYNLRTVPSAKAEENISSKLTFLYDIGTLGLSYIMRKFVFKRIENAKSHSFVGRNKAKIAMGTAIGTIVGGLYIIIKIGLVGALFSIPYLGWAFGLASLALAVVPPLMQAQKIIQKANFQSSFEKINQKFQRSQNVPQGIKNIVQKRFDYLEQEEISLQEARQDLLLDINTTEFTEKDQVDQEYLRLIAQIQSQQKSFIKALKKIESIYLESEEIIKKEDLTEIFKDLVIGYSQSQKQEIAKTLIDELNKRNKEIKKKIQNQSQVEEGNRDTSQIEEVNDDALQGEEVNNDEIHDDALQGEEVNNDEIHDDALQGE